MFKQRQEGHCSWSSVGGRRVKKSWAMPVSYMVVDIMIRILDVIDFS